MNPCPDSRLTLKHSAGFFAAGRELEHALRLLSDGAFKIFVYTCLQADRRSSAADEKLAAKWYQAGVPLDQVQRAILMGCARKYVALFNHNGGSPITSLEYFTGIVEEVSKLEMSLDYWRYLAARTRKMESQWRAHANLAPAKPASNSETN